MSVHPSVKRGIQAAFRALGLRIQRIDSLPFGVDWLADVRWCLGHQPMRVAFDVGANVGQTAHAITRAFPDCRVWSFEPVESTFAELQENVRRLRNVEAVRCALSAATGEGLVTAIPLSGHNRIVTEATAQDSVPAARTPMETVASIAEAQGIETIDLLKIDTEGHETDVLRGAETMLNEGRIKFVFSECGFIERPDEPHADFAELFTLLTGHGFGIVAFYSAGVDNLGWRWGNVLFRHLHDSSPGDVYMSPLAGDRASR